MKTTWGVAADGEVFLYNMERWEVFKFLVEHPDFDLVRVTEYKREGTIPSLTWEIINGNSDPIERDVCESGVLTSV